MHRACLRPLAWAVAILAAAAVVALPASAAQSNVYTVHPLVSDVPGAAPTTDPHLVNAWGLTASATSPWWVADNGTDLSTLYTANGAKIPFEVTVDGGPTVAVFDGSWQPVLGGFVDPRLPAGYAPFGIQTIGNRIFVSYAKQDADAEDEVAGQGLGFVDAYSTGGVLLARVAQHGQLNAPWGLALAPPSFGRFGGDLLVGNFGDGQINAYQETAA